MLCCYPEKGEEADLYEEKLLSYSNPLQEGDLSEWMSKLDEHLTKIPINQLAIPGSHDSGAYYLDPKTPICPDESKIIKTLGPLDKNIVINWSLTQEHTITDQLTNGVRYFDMRSGYLKSADDFLFVHGIYGHPITDMLKEIKTFLQSNSREVVLIDFNHFYSFTAELHQRFSDQITTIFKDKIYTSTNGGEINMSLADFWASKKQVLIRYCDADTCKKNKQFHPTDSISSPWFNTDSVNNLINKLNGNFSTLQPGKINVFQAILTAQTETIIFHLFSSLKKCLAEKCDAAVKNWLSDVYTRKQQGVNVVICDFIKDYECSQYIIKLNNLIIKNK